VGGSGAGKTWLAERLACALELDTGRVSLDNFYRDLSHLTLAARARSNFDHPEAMDWGKVREVIDAMAQGQPITIPSYDFSTHVRKPQAMPWVSRPVVIWDGLWLLHPPWLRERFTFAIYVECPSELRLERRATRDQKERGRSRASVEQQFHAHVEPMHQRYVAPQKKWARCCVHSPVSESALLDLTRQVKTEIHA
jgi:uridine kinase